FAGYKMKFFEDLLTSIAGNTKARVNDPFFGAFILTWALCNWNYLAVLFWGEGSASKRIDDFYKYLVGSEFFSLNTIFFVPLLLTIFYLFLFPWLSFAMKFLQKNANDTLHKQAVDNEIRKVFQQEELNKARLRSNPDKQFL